MRLYLRYFSIHVQSAMEYKVSFLLTMLGQFFVAFNTFLGMYFLFRRFPQVRGYTFAECLLCFAIVLMSFSLAECFFRGFDMFSSMIGNGEFDRVLVRPQGLVFQVLCSKLELTRLGRLLQAVALFAYAIPHGDVVWTGMRVAGLLLMIAGGIVVFSSVFLLRAALCFFTLESLEVLNVFTDGIREFGKYPFDVYGRAVLRICTYIVPFALVQYYPFLYLIGRTDNAAYLLLPLAACLFVVPCYALWRLGVSRYKSTGS